MFANVASLLSEEIFSFLNTTSTTGDIQKIYASKLCASLNFLLICSRLQNSQNYLTHNKSPLYANLRPNAGHNNG